MILYSSNPNDLICDFFLGSFSTAKVAISLERRACGFEINKNAFDYQIQTINVPNLEKPPISTTANEIKVPIELFSHKDQTDLRRK